jgi:hypothetical protein
MCWNASVSLQTFMIGLLGILFAGNLLSLPMTLFLASIVGMQFIEYLMWTFGENKTANFSISLAAAFLLWLQPIASIQSLTSTSTATTLTILYTVLSVIYKGIYSIIDKTPLQQTYRMYKGANGHLVWNWLQFDVQTAIGLLLYFTFLLLPIIMGKNWPLLSVIAVTLGISLYTFYNDRTWGSMWCWIVNAIVLYVCGKAVWQLYG